MKNIILTILLSLVFNSCECKQTYAPDFASTYKIKVTYNDGVCEIIEYNAVCDGIIELHTLRDTKIKCLRIRYPDLCHGFAYDIIASDVSSFKILNID